MIIKMKDNKLPLKELSIKELYKSEKKKVYEVPVYQRNYAWEKDEITTLIQDVYDAYSRKDKEKEKIYYIGTLVTFFKGDDVYEVIDGQQRLTTIYLILNALGFKPDNPLTYKARKKSNSTIKHIPDFDTDEKDKGIVDGYRYVEEAIREIGDDKEEFRSFFLENVHIIHYEVPRDIDLNHYFEIMNSRGEQLEKHEILKAELIGELSDSGDKTNFNTIWEACSEMSEYIQDKYPDISFFRDGFGECFKNYGDENKISECKKSILEFMINTDYKATDNEPKTDGAFQPIIDFSNFLLIVLKITRILAEKDFNACNFILDDKKLISEFHAVDYNSYNGKRGFAKIFACNLLKAKYYLDNFIVHHSEMEDTTANNPWDLQHWNEKSKKPESLCGDNEELQNKLMHLLSMFEVSFVPKQRKNYLFYCLLYLFKNKIDRKNRETLQNYANFIESLADRYFYDIYLDGGQLNAANVPKPSSFDEVILSGNTLTTELNNKNVYKFNDIYGDGDMPEKEAPSLFVFNYIDYKIWKFYADNMRGEKLKEESEERKVFFSKLGCSDFGLKIFNNFYFSRTRRSLEHYFPQANVSESTITKAQINCLGNFAMIGSDANTSGSNMSPIEKLRIYGETGKNLQISVASMKFIIMMQKCRDNYNNPQREHGQEWNFEDIKEHQQKILELIAES